MNKKEALVLWFDQTGIEDVPLVGGKNASLGEMYTDLVPKGVPVPNGFSVTAYAYRKFIEANNLAPKIRALLEGLDTSNVSDLEERGRRVRELIIGAEFPEELKNAIKEAYHHLGLQYGENPDVAVRSSATAEDLPDASFAGQQETFLNIRGNVSLLEACKKCFASLFTGRAISYRVDKGFDHFSVALSIGVQKMVRSDLACSGVMFSIDTETGFKNAVLINSSYGLGENIVQGAVNPDEFYVFKPTLKKGFRPIISKKLGEKSIKMVYTDSARRPVKNVKTSEEERNKFTLEDDEILKLATYAVKIEEHYSEKAGHYKPMDMEWAKDGLTGELFIVQARPETVQSQVDRTKIKTYVLKEKGPVLIEGRSVGSKIGSGRIHVIKSAKQINEFKEGEVLVTDMTDPDWEPIMKIASAIITNRGGRTCHAAIISRELGIPCVVGTNNATEILKDGQVVTIDCSSGEDGKVYLGNLKYEVIEEDLSNIRETKTKIMVNVGNPDEAFAISFLPAKGVGLAREEFIINSYIKIHPLALLHYGKLKDAKARKEIEKITRGYKNKEEFYVDNLARGIGMICAAFYPRPVIVRMADFKSNEYANLIGGKEFEPVEDNPMIGWRGASRYYSEKYREAFGLECRAFKKVLEEFGLTNMKVMIPMCRTVEEGKKVLAEMKKNNLVRGQNGLEVYVMCEVPSNVLLAEQFLEIFDGFSIGSNDLTQFTLGVDRDSELVAHIFDERNLAVKRMIEHAIEVANSMDKYIGICGQAPSDYPEFAEFLVEKGITSISLNPDVFMKTRMVIQKKEEELGILPG